MDFKEFKKLLEDCEPITFSNHVKIKAKIRSIRESDIIDNLKNPKNLILAEDQGPDKEGKGGHKYALIFKQFSNYDLKIVIVIEGKGIKVITVHIQNIRRRKAYKKWLQN